MSTTQVPQQMCSRPFRGDELSLVRKIISDDQGEEPRKGASSWMEESA
jgi:hypothetical protein